MVYPLNLVEHKGLFSYMLVLMKTLCKLMHLGVYFQKAAKRKKIHSFKSKVRSEQLEVAQNKRQNAWQQFQSAKGKTKKVNIRKIFHSCL